MRLLSLPTFASFSPLHSGQATAITTQTGAGGPLINGQASDTGTGTPSSSTSYVKANAYGYGVDGAGAQQTPAANSLTTPVASTDGAAGGVAPLANAWIPTHWQSLQGWIQYIVNGIVPAQAAGQWFWSVLAYIGPNMLTGQFTWVATLQYNYT